jgi:hypothetical protein
MSESLGTAASERPILRAPDERSDGKRKTCSSFGMSLQASDDITQFDSNKELNDI